MIDLLKNWPVGEPVPAISLRQPWASAVAFFSKDIENRSNWPFKHRGPLIIHASKTVPYGEDFERFIELAREADFTDEDLEGISANSYRSGLFPQGYILGVANLAEVFRNGDTIPDEHPVHESRWKSTDAKYWL